MKVWESLSPWIRLNGGTPQKTQLAPLLFCFLVNKMAAVFIGSKYVGHETVIEVTPRLLPLYLHFTASDIHNYMLHLGL